MSHMPGITVFPVASMTVAPAGVATESAGPTATMRSPWTTTVIRGRITACSLSKRLPLRITSGPPSGFVSRRARASPCALRQRTSTPRSTGSVASAPARTVMNQATSLANSSSRSSSQTPAGAGPPASIITRRRCCRPSDVATVVSATTSARAAPAGKSRPRCSGWRRRNRARSASSNGVPPNRGKAPVSARATLFLADEPPRPPACATYAESPRISYRTAGSPVAPSSSTGRASSASTAPFPASR